MAAAGRACRRAAPKTAWISNTEWWCEEPPKRPVWANTADPRRPAPPAREAPLGRYASTLCIDCKLDLAAGQAPLGLGRTLEARPACKCCPAGAGPLLSLPCGVEKQIEACAMR